MRIALLLTLALVFVLGTVAGATQVVIRDTLAKGVSTSVQDGYMRSGSEVNLHNYNPAEGTEVRLFGDTNAAPRRMLQWFDLSSIPTNATITSATYSVWIDDVGTIATTALQLRRITAGPWGEGPGAWNTPLQAGNPSWTWRIYNTAAWQAGGAGGVNDTDQTPAGVINFNWLTGSGYIKHDVGVTSWVQAWVNGSVDNFGFVFKALDTGTGSGYYKVPQSEQLDVLVRPMLTVDYVIPEPSSLLAFATGLIGLAGMAIRRKR